VAQLLGTTRIEIKYSRPSARGRALFGALVPWGREWTPGADTATSIALTAPVRVNGHALAAGTYTIWAIPTATRWTFIFSRAHPVWHLPYPAGEDVLRIESTPQSGSYVELLTWEFPVVDGYSGELVVRWGTTVVPITIDAHP
jgi:hypothetical protein